MRRVLQELNKLNNVELREDFNFGKSRSSFKIDGVVKYYIATSDLNTLKSISKILSLYKKSFHPIGGGSNILINDYYDGIFLEYTDDRILTFTDKDGDFILRTFAGVGKQQLLKKSLELELTGAEFLAGIPGKVGGGVAMNAGAYGGDFKHIMKRVAVCHNGDGKFYDVKDLDIQYRNFNFPHKPYMITFADIKLKKSNKASIREKITKNLTQKKQTQPLEYPSAGSVFKNPKSKPAWQYIKELGLAGRRIGNAMFSEKHSNFIVNLGNAKASDVVNLIQLAKIEAKEQLGVSLEEEIQIF